MDRSWMRDPDRLSTQYLAGIKGFIEHAKKHVDKYNKISCPCLKCRNLKMWEVNIVHKHLFADGIEPLYTIWVHHGEVGGFKGRNSNVVQQFAGSDDHEAINILNDAFPYASGAAKSQYMDYDDEFDDEGGRGSSFSSLDDFEKYERLLKEAQRELYEECNEFSVLSAVVELMHMKVTYLVSNKCFDVMLAIISRMLRKDHRLPQTHYHCMKILKDLGLGYDKIDACPNDCVLFYKEHQNKDKCPVCGELRYKHQKSDVQDDDGKNRKKIPRKVLRYFPLRPRLQRLYMEKHIASSMKWHKEERAEDGVMRHPADSEAWKEFDRMHPEFAEDPRNVRLGLASDGFNPNNNMTKPYSMWPVITIPYNLPPWLCMKKEFSMLSLLIPGPKAPSGQIDVYLRPLIDELKDLWEIGVPTFDKTTNSIFNLRVAVLWTINDFPAYGNLSGWRTKGYTACPVCNEDVTSLGIRGKICYMGHRRWLPHDHPWRFNAEAFDGNTEHRVRPKEFSGIDHLAQVDKISNFGEKVMAPKEGKKRKRVDPKGKDPKNSGRKPMWSKKSILFELSYWSKLKIRHNLDVMHIEKNVCDNIAGTILDIEGKTKDTIKGRQDCMDMCIKKKLWLKRKGDKYFKDHPDYTVKPSDKREFMRFLASVKFPDGYASNIANCVNFETGKLTGLKTHDCHVLLQRLLPVGIRKYLKPHVVDPIMHISSFFQQLCAKCVTVSDMERLEKEIVLTLCKLEQVFFPAFFDVMIHLMVHIAHEVKIAGPVTFRWMYPIERMMGTYKKYVRNKAHPEGSIAETYIANEALSFCSMYLKNVDTSFSRPDRYDDGGIRSETIDVFAQRARPFSWRSTKYLSEEEIEVIQWYILENCEEVKEYMEEHANILMMTSMHDIEGRQRKEFPRWFKQRIEALRMERSPSYKVELLELASGPIRFETYMGSVVNGIKFIGEARDDKLKTQNSGVYVPGTSETESIDYYGKLIDVIEVQYRQRYRVILFRCHWYNTDPEIIGSVKRDYHLKSVNTKTRWFENNPYILATQAQQVFYLDDHKAGDGWKVVQEMTHRNVWNIPDKNKVQPNKEVDAYQEDSSSMELEQRTSPTDNGDVVVPDVRIDVDPIAIDAITIDLGPLPTSHRVDRDNFINDDEDGKGEDDSDEYDEDSDDDSGDSEEEGDDVGEEDDGSEDDEDGDEYY